VALLRDPETRKVGRAIVSSPVGGSVELADKGVATRIVIGQPPSRRFRLSDAQIQQLFGDALAALPPAPRHFQLYFVSGSNQLTPKSERLLAEILPFVKSRSVPDVTVVGHTDTTGNAQTNIEFGRNRATLIRDRLVAAGLDASIVSVASHGEADLLVPTPDDTAEPKNRRADVSVR
jgi:outer membrane protein OmpA-like peptidoglycan-associated protein